MGSVGDALDTLLQDRDVEVYQQPKRVAIEPQRHRGTEDDWMGSVGDSLDALLKDWNVEVDQQPKR